MVSGQYTTPMARCSTDSRYQRSNEPGWNRPACFSRIQTPYQARSIGSQRGSARCDRTRHTARLGPRYVRTSGELALAVDMLLSFATIGRPTGLAPSALHRAAESTKSTDPVSDAGGHVGCTGRRYATRSSQLRRNRASHGPRARWVVARRPTAHGSRAPVRSAHARNDQGCADRVRDRYGRLRVVRGRVILRGCVRDQRVASRIERILSEVAPDALIDNRIRIGP